MMDPLKNFNEERKSRVLSYAKDQELKNVANRWTEELMRKKVVYNFDWLGRPIIQNPMDIIAVQEITWKIKPTLIIETGIAHGGSLILSASLLALNELCGGPKNSKVIGVDIDIREHNRKKIEEHPLSNRIEMIEGSSVSEEVAKKVKSRVSDNDRVLIFLDSNHTHDHVLEELKIYSNLVSKNSYIVVFDTFVEDMPEDLFPNRPWSPGNSGKTAVHEFLRKNESFQIDQELNNKYISTVAPDGFLKRLK